ncbi:MAG: hypothetical protein RL711_1369 [Bacteroidota bacterium]|jgi:hypothetical protein
MISRITERLSALGVQITTIAPAINSVDDLHLKSPSEVAKRLVILSYLIGVYYDVDAKDLVEQLKKYKLYGSLTPAEQALLSQNEYDEQDVIDAGWLQECIEIVGWSLGMSNKPLDHQNEAGLSMAEYIPVMKNPEKFIEKAALLSPEKILEEYLVLHHIFHFLQHEEHLLIDADIILERCRAINWICGIDTDWI